MPMVATSPRQDSISLLAVSQLRTSPLSFWLIDARGDLMLLTRLGGAYDKLPVEQIAPLREVSYRPSGRGCRIAVTTAFPTAWQSRIMHIMGNSPTDWSDTKI
jgi:hypothetical protein